ncbi:MAG: hypothetical protein L0332_00475 [Chloroflexi bacterium]|nr:hypothetical protein [Chloroflexota bacterium]MCI0575989.1 hypothetical protein [Chloroflexota bacterium]MCI0648229.1 hypothetical protein [Chloroflexota bacterium]MCI0725199.1 hypothetical protein [Chloroflexota bacterium]
MAIQPLPTLVPLATVPPWQSGPAVAQGLPATYTAVPSLTPVTALPPTPTLAPTATPTPLPTAAPSPTLDVAPNLFPQPVFLSYLNQAPAVVDCGQGIYFRSQFPSAVDGPWRTYSVYLPPCYGQDGRVYPVVYLIHGSIQTDSHWLDLGLARYADTAINSGRSAPFIAIMPYSDELGNRTSGGERSVEGITVNYLLPFVDNAFCTWATAAGRSIGGISRGGYWALEIAFLHPDLFSAVSGHSSHLRFETDPARYNPLATYATANLLAMRIWLDRGETDFLRVGQDQLHNRLLAAGIAHEYRVNPGGHNDQYWLAHLAEYLDWHAAAWPKDRLAYPPCLK